MGEDVGGAADAVGDYGAGGAGVEDFVGAAGCGLVHCQFVNFSSDWVCWSRR